MSEPEHVIPFDELPEGFARNVEVPPQIPVAPRPAATIVLMRDGDEGPEILLLRRSHRSGFVPGAWVFPGGRVDRSDAHQALVDRVDGMTPERVAQRLDLADTDEAMAYLLAALREAFEETGILVAHRADGSHPPAAAESDEVEALRNAVLEDRMSFAEALDRLECRIDGEAVAYAAHWITPEVEPRRYDARFFAAAVPSDSEAVVDPREMTDAVWLTPDAALSRFHAGELPLVFPTIKTLEQLGEFSSVDEALHVLEERDVPPIMPRLVITPEGVGTEVD